MTQVSDPVGLRDPLHQVSPRAVAYWRTSALIGAFTQWSILIALYYFALPVVLDGPQRPGWAIPLLGLGLVLTLVHVLVMPPVRFHIHRWEFTSTAIHTRSGWLSINSRVAPLNRVQTVDSNQGALMRLFGLASLTVTTASAAGAVTINCLDREVAQRLVEELTAITSASRGDAT